jgi:hypothetical protein
MGIDHQPTPGPNENNDTGPLTQEFSLFLKSDPMRAQKLVFELSISRFCYEVGSFGNISPKDLARFFSTKRPHKTVKEIRDFFEPCFGGGEEELRKRLEVVCSAIESTVPAHVALSPQSASPIRGAFCNILLCQSALCIGSHELSQVIIDTESGIEESINNRFWEKINHGGQRIASINLSDNLPPALKRKSKEALANELVIESNKLKHKINSRIADLKNLYEPLIAHSVERLHDIVPSVLNDYLHQPYKQDLAEYTRDAFETIFNSEVSKMQKQRIYDIDAALETLRNSMR